MNENLPALKPNEICEAVAHWLMLFFEANGIFVPSVQVFLNGNAFVTIMSKEHFDVLAGILSREGFSPEITRDTLWFRWDTRNLE